MNNIKTQAEFVSDGKGIAYFIPFPISQTSDLGVKHIRSSDNRETLLKEGVDYVIRQGFIDVDIPQGDRLFIWLLTPAQIVEANIQSQAFANTLATSDLSASQSNPTQSISTANTLSDIESRLNAIEREATAVAVKAEVYKEAQAELAQAQITSLTELNNAATIAVNQLDEVTNNSLNELQDTAKTSLENMAELVKQTEDLASKANDTLDQVAEEKIAKVANIAENATTTLAEMENRVIQSLANLASTGNTIADNLTEIKQISDSVKIDTANQTANIEKQLERANTANQSSNALLLQTRNLLNDTERSMQQGQSQIAKSEANIEKQVNDFTNYAKTANSKLNSLIAEANTVSKETADTLRSAQGISQTMTALANNVDQTAKQVTNTVKNLEKNNQANQLELEAKLATATNSIQTLINDLADQNATNTQELKNEVALAKQEVDLVNVDVNNTATELKALAVQMNKDAVITDRLANAAVDAAETAFLAANMATRATAQAQNNVANYVPSLGVVKDVGDVTNAISGTYFLNSKILQSPQAMIGVYAYPKDKWIANQNNLWDGVFFFDTGEFDYTNGQPPVPVNPNPNQPVNPNPPDGAIATYLANWKPCDWVQP